MELLSLPVEMLDEIFRYLAPKDIISLSHTCKKLRGMTESDQLWIQACRNEFKISIPSSSNGLAQRYYKSVLQRYGNLLGFWMKPSCEFTAEDQDGQPCQIKDYYGGLLQVMYSDSQIIGFDLLPPKVPHLMEPLRPEKLFTISMDESNQAKAVIKCYCRITPLKHDICELTLSDEGCLTMECGTDDQQDSGEFDFASYFQENNKLETLMQCAANMIGHSYCKLALPRAISRFLVPIQPGLFKGTYAEYGIQIIVLKYINLSTVRAIKITGDQNIPSGVRSFGVDLRAAMYLNEEAQSNMDMLGDIDDAPALTWYELPNSQPFVLPQGWTIDGNLIIPDQCKTRFFSTGVLGWQRTPTGVIEATDKGHWIVFNEDLFGYLWISSRKFSLFHRV